MDVYTALLYNETNALSLILLLIILLYTARNHDVRAKLPSSMGFIISLIVLAVGDIFWALVEGSIIPFSEWGSYGTNLVYFGGTLASVYFLFMISRDIFGYRGNYLKQSLLFLIPFVADYAFVCLTPVTHMVFFVENGVYQRGVYYPITLLIPYAFVLYLSVSSFVKSFRPQYFVIRRSLRILTLYSVGTLLLSFFQLAFKYVFPLYVVGGAMICVVIYIDMINEFNTIDPLTKVHNLRSFENHLAGMIKKGCDAEKNIYLIMLDIDDFKSINEIFGHEEGERILPKFAKTVSAALPTGWFVARFGSDEFAAVGICLPEEIDRICDMLGDALDDWNAVSAKPYTVTASIGYAAFSYSCKSVYDFIRLAEKHMEIARALNQNGARPSKRKTAGGTTASAADPAPVSQQDINLWMHDALKNGQFVPYFQPQINLADNTVSGAEALARWIHPEKGILSPAVFIPVFERNGFIYEMDKYIWHSVCAAMRRWRDRGLNVPPISVNVSRWDVVQNDFIQTILSYLQEFDLSPSDLHLEITESAYLFDQDYLAHLMEELQQLGFEIEMDDFGSGYSSLTAFKDLPFDLVKLDSALVRESTANDKAGRILEGVVKLTENLKMPLIAEGVEFKEQAELLKRIGCSHMQGFLFAKAMPEDKFLEFIADWSKTE